MHSLRRLVSLWAVLGSSSQVARAIDAVRRPEGPLSGQVSGWCGSELPVRAALKQSADCMTRPIVVERPVQEVLRSFRVSGLEGRVTVDAVVRSPATNV